MTSPAASLRDVLSQAGFTGQGLETAVAVAMAESGGRPMAHNGNAGTGDNSYGLFQINMLGNLGPARLEQYGLNSNDDLYDPLTNARVAFKLSNGGTNWQPWTTYTRGTYEQFLGQDPPLGGTGALGAAGGDDGHGGDDTGALAPASTNATTMAGTGYDIGSGTPLSSLMPSRSVSAAQIAYLTGQDALPEVATSGAGGPLGGGATGAQGNTPPAGVAEHFVAVAVAQRGDAYEVAARGTGQADPTKFDCSGLVQWSAHQVGVDLPNTSYEQFLQLKAEGALIPVDQAIHTPGALLFHFSEEPTPGGAPPDDRHVAISLGNGRTIEAANPDDGVDEFNATGRFEYAAIVPGIGAATTSPGPTTLAAGTSTLLAPDGSDHDDPWESMSAGHSSPLGDLMHQGGSGPSPMSELMDDPGHSGFDLGH